MSRGTHGRGIVAILGEVLAETSIFISDGILKLEINRELTHRLSRRGRGRESYLVNLREEKDGQCSTEDTEST